MVWDNLYRNFNFKKLSNLIIVKKEFQTVTKVLYGSYFTNYINHIVTGSFSSLAV